MLQVRRTPDLTLSRDYTGGCSNWTRSNRRCWISGDEGYPPYEIYAGVPARKIGERFTDPADRVRHNEMLDGPVIEGQFCPPGE